MGLTDFIGLGGWTSATGSGSGLGSGVGWGQTAGSTMTTYRIRQRSHECGLKVTGV
jgi:hypothetical protein